jgi:hypothetical protein
MFTVRWLETTILGIFVSRDTGSPFIVVAVTLLPLLPMELLGAFLGTSAERTDRRLALIVAVVLMLSAPFLLLLRDPGGLARSARIADQRHRLGDRQSGVAR